MNNQILAILIQEGSRLVTEAIRNRTAKPTQVTEQSLLKFIDDSDTRMSKYISEPIKATPVPQIIEVPKETPVQINIHQEQTEIVPGKAASIAEGCVPCALGHVGTCTGLLNESIRFAHTPEGMASPQVVDRVNMCLDELNAMERVDLRPEMLIQLQGWEKNLADQTLTSSRALRHDLEAIQTLDDLETAAAKTQTVRKDIGRKWFQNKLSKLPESDKEEISRRVMEKINEMANVEAE